MLRTTSFLFSRHPHRPKAVSLGCCSPEGKFTTKTSQRSHSDNGRLDGPRGLSCCHTVSITVSNWSPSYSCLANYCLSFAKCEGLHMKEYNAPKPATDVGAQAAWLRRISKVTTALVVWCLRRDLWGFDVNSVAVEKTCTLSSKEFEHSVPVGDACWWAAWVIKLRVYFPSGTVATLSPYKNVEIGQFCKTPNHVKWQHF